MEECPVCYEEYGHAPYCPIEAEQEADEQEFAQQRKEALRALKRTRKASKRTFQPQPAALPGDDLVEAGS